MHIIVLIWYPNRFLVIGVPAEWDGNRTSTEQVPNKLGTETEQVPAHSERNGTLQWNGKISINCLSRKMKLYLRLWKLRNHLINSNPSFSSLLFLLWVPCLPKPDGIIP